MTSACLEAIAPSRSLKSKSHLLRRRHKVKPTLALAASVTCFLLPISAHAGQSSGAFPGDPNACPAVVMAQDGMPAPGGGFLNVLPIDAPSINDAGDIAFFARVVGDVRDRGLFFADAAGLQSIARACATPGCGDPTPLGGTYESFVGGSLAPPALNDLGDIVFTARVVGGGSEVGHFLYRAETGLIEKIAAPGDPSPQGGVLDVIGGAAFNNDGDIVFGAWDVGDDPFMGTYLLRWRDGQLERVLGPGDSVPGGVISRVGGAHIIVDGFRFLTSPSPFVAEDGRILVNVVSNDLSGVLEFSPQSSRWIVRSGDPVPGGDGTFTVFSGAPSRGGHYAFSSEATSGIFSGAPGQWQAAWLQGQLVEGDPVDSLPRLSGLQPILDNDGQLTFILGFQPVANVFEDRLMRWNADEGLFVLTRTGDPAPGGGTIEGFGTFNEVNAAGDLIIGTYISSQSGFLDAFIRLDNCGAEIVFADGFESGNLEAWSSSAP